MVPRVLVVMQRAMWGDRNTELRRLPGERVDVWVLTHHPGSAERWGGFDDLAAPELAEVGRCCPALDPGWTGTARAACSAATAWPARPALPTTALSFCTTLCPQRSGQHGGGVLKWHLQPHCYQCPVSQVNKVSRHTI